MSRSTQLVLERHATAVAVGGAFLVVLPLMAVAFLPMKQAVIALTGLAAVVGASVIALFGAHMLPAALFVGLVAVVSVPIDKYVAYQEHVGGWPGLRISVADLLLFALLPLLALGIAAGRLRNRIPGLLYLFYGLWIVAYLVSTLGAIDSRVSFFEIASAVHALALAIVVSSFFSRRYIPWIVALVAAQIVAHTVFAGLQMATGRPIGVGLGASPGDLVLETFESGSSRIRPAGLFDHPIVYGNYLMLGLPLLAAGALTAKRWLSRVILWAAAIAAAMGLAMTLSRGAWLSTCVTGFVFLFFGWRQRLLARGQVFRVVGVALAGCLIVGIAFGPIIYDRLTSSQAGNLEVRFELNKIALRMIAAHPLTGIGVNNFIQTMAPYDPDDVMEYFPATVHNLYLLEASEAGLPALAMLIGIMAVIAGSTFRRLRYIQDPAVAWFIIALFAGLSGFALSQLADFSHRLEPLRSVLWVNVGLLFGALSLARKYTTGEQSDGS